MLIFFLTSKTFHIFSWCFYRWLLFVYWIWCRCSVFIVNFEEISRIVLLFLWLTLKNQIPTLKVSFCFMLKKGMLTEVIRKSCSEYFFPKFTGKYLGRILFFDKLNAGEYWKVSVFSIKPLLVNHCVKTKKLSAS